MLILLYEEMTHNINFRTSTLICFKAEKKKLLKNK